MTHRHHNDAIRALAFPLLVALSAAASGCGALTTPSCPGPDVTDADRACDVDDDCAIVDTGSCPCNSGGTQIAVRAARAEALSAAHAAAGSFCSDVISDDPSCAASEVVCRFGRCELVAGVVGYFDQSCDARR